jgi:hypothetical protein
MFLLGSNHRCFTLSNLHETCCIMAVGRVRRRDTMKFSTLTGWALTLGLATVLAAQPAAAEVFQMNCTNSRYSYRITFDNEAKRFQWASDAGQVDYIVIRYKAEEDGVTVWGKVRRYGNEFVAYFASEGWMKSLYANGSSMTDVCRGK